VGAATPQLGAAAAQPQPMLQSLQHRLLRHFDLQQEVSQQLVSQPQPLAPSMRSSSSKPKLWVQSARPSTNDPKSEVRFIERRLLNDGTIELAHVPVRPDHVTRLVTLEDAADQRHVGPILVGSPIANVNLAGCASTGRPGVQEGRVACPARWVGVVHPNRSGSILGQNKSAPVHLMPQGS